MTHEATERCWQELGNAIILRAVEDYRHVCKLLKQNSDNLEKQREKNKLERFFRSDWFKVLTSLDGRQLLADLRKEAA